MINDDDPLTHATRTLTRASIAVGIVALVLLGAGLTRIARADGRVDGMLIKPHENQTVSTLRVDNIGGVWFDVIDVNSNHGTNLRLKAPVRIHPGSQGSVVVLGHDCGPAASAGLIIRTWTGIHHTIDFRTFERRCQK